MVFCSSPLAHCRDETEKIFAMLTISIPPAARSNAPLSTERFCSGDTLSRCSKGKQILFASHWRPFSERNYSNREHQIPIDLLVFMPLNSGNDSSRTLRKGLLF